MNYKIVLILLLTACQPKPLPNNNFEQYQQQRFSNFKTNVYPKIIEQCKKGYLITRLGADITSEIFRQLNNTNQQYSHCGIISIEADTVFVYHAIGGEFNPNQKIKREPLYSFLYANENKAVGIFKPSLNTKQLNIAMGFAIKHYTIGTMFDMQFDYTTDNKMYCAEFIAKDYESTNALKFKHTQRKNNNYVAVDNLFLDSMMTEVIQIKY